MRIAIAMVLVAALGAVPLLGCAHKVRNVSDKPPEELKDQVRSVMTAAYRLPWKEGMAKP